MEDASKIQWRGYSLRKNVWPFYCNLLGTGMGETIYNNAHHNRQSVVISQYIQISKHYVADITNKCFISVIPKRYVYICPCTNIYIHLLLEILMDFCLGKKGPLTNILSTVC